MYHPNDPAYIDHNPCVICGDHNDDLNTDACNPCIREQEREAGADLYRTGRPYSECRNALQREGWGDAEWEVERHK